MCACMGTPRWHQSPNHSGICSQEETDAHFQDADSRFVYLDASHASSGQSSATLPPVATAFSHLSPQSQPQDFRLPSGLHSTMSGALHTASSAHQTPEQAPDPQQAAPSPATMARMASREALRPHSSADVASCHASFSSGGDAPPVDTVACPMHDSNGGGASGHGMPEQSWRGGAHADGDQQVPSLAERPVGSATGDSEAHSALGAMRRGTGRSRADSRAVAEGRCWSGIHGSTIDSACMMSETARGCRVDGGGGRSSFAFDGGAVACPPPEKERRTAELLGRSVRSSGIERCDSDTIALG